MTQTPSDDLRAEIEQLLRDEDVGIPLMSQIETELVKLVEREKKKAVEEALSQHFEFLHGVPVQIPEKERNRVLSDMFPQ